MEIKCLSRYIILNKCRKLTKSVKLSQTLWCKVYYLKLIKIVQSYKWNHALNQMMMVGFVKGLFLNYFFVYLCFSFDLNFCQRHFKQFYHSIFWQYSHIRI